ncbi:terminase small subunit [Oryzomonas sagensis]|uniref:Terminase small subunit n=1 Tax=Oryzomonas sagensis TaxID=2603857 RepID=A0ABQ6TNW6_9BACT|nr:terminase small subunit [Oryzomonas sagensis]KAB0670284.1 terminase small subunit [Oryzomonas sagensis]
MLTNKQTLFVNEYLVDLNATQAAIRAGYSARTAHVAGYNLLHKPEAAEAVRKGLQERAEKLNLSGEDVLRSIVDIRGKAVTGGNLTQALKANELLGKHLKLFTDRVEHAGPDGGPLEFSDLELSNRLLTLIAILEERADAA